MHDKEVHNKKYILSRKFYICKQSRMQMRKNLNNAVSMNHRSL